MEMIVCIKQVPDPEAPPASFRIDSSAKRVEPLPGIPPVASPFDECALEAALRIKDAAGGNITVLSLGGNLLRDVAKKALAMGADRLVLLEDKAFEGGDGWTTAHALAMAIKKIGACDLIFCGRQSADWDGGLVGPGIAALLGLPCITLARKVEVISGKARVEKIITDGYKVLEADLPAVITVSNELGPPRFTTIAGIMTSKNKPMEVWKPGDVGLDPSRSGEAGRRARLVKLFQPLREGRCEFIEGDTPAEAGTMLALKLREARLL